MIDTGEDKKKLAFSLGAEKWIDFKESKDLVADVQSVTGGIGSHAAIIATGNVCALLISLLLLPTLSSTTF
jgi:propanol-preferring alcohol dehydrogenase